MKTFKKIILITSILVTIGLIFLWYVGLFSNIKIDEKKAGGYKVVGKEIIGPYSKAGQYIKEVESKLKGLGIGTTKGFGIYYDDPKITSPQQCRAFVGTIIEEKDFNKIKNMQLTDLKIDSIPIAESIVAEFPLKNTLSYMIGPMKVYPAFSKYIKEKKYKTTLSFEIYDVHEKVIVFVMQYTP